MSKVNLKDNIWICGFDSEKEVSDIILTVSFDTFIYSGKTSDIPEEVAKDCVYRRGLNGKYIYADYSGKICTFTAKQSIQSACDKPYCIICKIN